LTELVVLSDIHVGSKYAIAPPNAAISQPSDDEDTAFLKLNRIQRDLYNEYVALTKKWAHPDILVINGEPIDGTNYHSPNDLWTTNVIDQMRACKTLIDMWHAKTIYVTRGSDYHVSLTGQPLEEFFGEMVGAKKVANKYASEILNLKVNGKVFNFAHHISISTVFHYKSTPLARELMLMKLNASHFFPRGVQADVVVRSHAHYFWVIQTSGQLGMITPCWKIEDWYMKKKGAGSVGDIGAVRFRIEKDGTIDWDVQLYKFESAKPTLVEYTST
jgi:hypothetical protein